MRKLLFAVPATLFAGVVVAQAAGQPNPLDPAAKAPPVVYRSAFEGYRGFADQEPSDWRKANAQVGAAGQKATKPAPAKPDAHHGHGGRK